MLHKIAVLLQQQLNLQEPNCKTRQDLNLFYTDINFLMYYLQIPKTLIGLSDIDYSTLQTLLCQTHYVLIS